jgi:S-DNA-T family DNA segregation ATPase FtsK/SpoIIIE
LYKIDFSKVENLVEKSSTSLLFFITILVFQSLIISNDMSGLIGDTIVNELSRYIGLAGLWLFVLIGFIISFIILFPQTKDNASVILLKLLDNKNKQQENNQFYKQQINHQIEKTHKEEYLFDDIPSLETVRAKENIPSFETIQAKEDITVFPNEEDIVHIRADGNIDEIIIQEVPVQKEIPIVQEIYTPKIEVSEQIIEEVVTKEPIIIKDIKKKIIPEPTTVVKELEENKKLLDDIELGKCENHDNFKLPKSSFFQKAPKQVKNRINESVIDQKVADLLEKLSMFKIEGDVVRTYSGPIVTTFEFKPAPNVKVSKILNLQDDLAMALKAQTIRIQAPIPGKDVVGIEVPNEDVDTIYLRDLLESELFVNSASPLTMILGKDIVGNAFVTDLKKLPHLLIAGTTGSGKSVGINSMILSLLYKNSPDNLKLIMIDPKMLEFSMYNDIPHLLTPVITKPNTAINALANMVGEMERRYQLMAKTKTKNIENYNEKARKNGEQAFPYIVIVIDELADLMMTSGKDVELSIARLAQMARASGIHLIVATQRPSVDVVTGLIKANLPSRISYKVGQKVDSKIILDAMGAESLLGRGDMLFTPPGSSNLVRIHAPWSDETEIEQVVDYLKAQRAPEYDESILKEKSVSGKSSSSSIDIGDLDSMYDDAKNVVLTDQKTSISYLQRKLRIGYNRSATIMEQLETMGVLSAPNAKGNREIL